MMPVLFQISLEKSTDCRRILIVIPLDVPKVSFVTTDDAFPIHAEISIVRTGNFVAMDSVSRHAAACVVPRVSTA